VWFSITAYLQETNMGKNASMSSTRDPLDPHTLRDGLVRIGEVAIPKGDDAALDRYFAEDFVFHGPAGDATLKDIKSLFQAMRNAFSNFAITRERIIVDGNFVAARTRISGIFEHELTHSPVGRVRPTGKSMSYIVHHIFRYDDHGRLAEEWALLDNLEFLKQIGVELKRDTTTSRS
jgi:predicted ester cyclase